MIDMFLASHGGSSGSLPMPDIHLFGFSYSFDFLKTYFFKIFDVLRHTYLFGNFSLLTFFIIIIVFDLIFAAFFVTFNIYQNDDTSSSSYSSRRGSASRSGQSQSSNHRFGTSARFGFRR